MNKLFVSMPMKGKTREEITAAMKKAHKDAENTFAKPLVLIDSVIENHENMKPLVCLGESIKRLAEADYAYFCKGFDSARGCMIEWRCAGAFGITRIAEGRDEK